MTWPIVGEGAIDSLKDQLRYHLPVREHAPMAELEARASRFVSLVVGHTENAKQPSNNSRALPLLLKPGCPMGLDPRLRVGLRHLGWHLECSTRRTALESPSLRER